MAISRSGMSADVSQYNGANYHVEQVILEVNRQKNDRRIFSL